jgi:hypothetical protein
VVYTPVYPSFRYLESFLTDNHAIEEKIQRQNLQKEADLEFEESERLRWKRKAKENAAKEAARERRREAESRQVQNGFAAGKV